MVDKHTQSFFGQSSGLTIQSASKKEPFIFFRCIQKKPDGSWERPSLGEGKTIKCNMDEIIMILHVLSKKIKSWSSYHNFNNIKTQISFRWEETNDDKLWVNIGKYSKMLGFPQVELLRLLLKHILKEKVEYATTPNSIETKKESTIPKTNTSIEETVENDDSVAEINGSIKSETEKAILVQFKDGMEIWIPKSTIQSNYITEKEVNQTFLIDNWILKKNNLN